MVVVKKKNNGNFRVVPEGSAELPLSRRSSLCRVVRQGAQSGRCVEGGGAESKHGTPLLSSYHELNLSGTDQGRWRPLTIPGPKLPSSDGRISCSDGWAQRRIRRVRSPGKSRAVPERAGRKFGSPKEPYLWLLAPPETGRRWQRCSDRELTSTTLT